MPLESWEIVFANWQEACMFECFSNKQLLLGCPCSGQDGWAWEQQQLQLPQEVLTLHQVTWLSSESCLEAVEKALGVAHGPRQPFGVLPLVRSAPNSWKQEKHKVRWTQWTQWTVKNIQNIQKSVFQLQSPHLWCTKIPWHSMTFNLINLINLMIIPVPWHVTWHQEMNQVAAVA